MINIIIPDKLHIHVRGFKSIIELQNKKKINLIHVEKYDNLKALYGNYNKHKSLFLKEYDSLSFKNQDELFHEKIGGYSLFKIIKSEMLSYLITKENWYSLSVLNDEQFIFNKAYEENKEDLLLNMAVGLFWFEFWKTEVQKHKDIKASIVFSGSLIYSKTFSFLLQNTPIKVYVVEHFFTGNDFYFEEKYTHIANNSDIRFPNIYNGLFDQWSEKEPLEKEKDIIKAINKINLSNNKNVKQPLTVNEKINFHNSERTILILGQVINDFSILETDINNINSLSIYKKMIQGIFETTNYNIIFKAHPWEKNKSNVNRPLTKEELNNFVMSNFTKNYIERFKIVEDSNINQLFEVSDIIVGICSQSLLEASFAGIKTHQIGKAFFGDKGFTYDHRDEKEFLKYIGENSFISPLMNMYEYENFLKFLTLSLQYHLVSVHKSGESMILNKIQSNYVSTIGIVKKHESILDISVENNTSNELKDSKDSKDSKEQEVICFDYSQNANFKKMLINKIVISLSNEKKVKKFKENPKRFFKDSKFFMVKFLGKIY